MKLGAKTINASLKDVVYDAPKGDFPHPNTMTCKLMAGDKVLLEQEYYSVGGGFIEWKGYTPPKKGAPKYPYETMTEVLAHCAKDKISLAQLAMANEMSISGKSEAEINAFLDKIMGAMRATVKTGLAAPTSTLPGPIKLKTKARDVYMNAQKQEGAARAGDRPRFGLCAGGLGGECARPPGHHRADRRLGRRACRRSSIRSATGGAKLSGREDPRRPARGGGRRLSLQAQCDAVGGRRRLPGRDRRRLGHGRGADRPGL